MQKKLLFTLSLIFLSYFGYSQIPTNGLVGHYKLDDGIYTDSSPSQFDLESAGAGGALNPIQDRFGETDKALNFVNEYLDLASNPTAFDFNSNSNFSLCVWIKIGTSIFDWAGILNNWASIQGGYYLGVNPTQGIRWNVNGPQPVDSPAAIPTNVWTHIVATYDGVDANLFVDGMLVSSAPNNVSIFASPYPFTVGTQADLILNKFPGAMDDILVYDRVLTGPEIVDIFTVLSIEDINAFSSQIIVYPNPLESSISVSYNKALGTIESYTLTDIGGRLIFLESFNGAQTSINLSAIDSGIYLLTLISIDGVEMTKKIIKK